MLHHKNQNMYINFYKPFFGSCIAFSWYLRAHCLETAVLQKYRKSLEKKKWSFISSSSSLGIISSLLGVQIVKIICIKQLKTYSDELLEAMLSAMN